MRFGQPVRLGAVRLWNYAKTPERGVRLFSLFLDDALIFAEYCAAAGSEVAVQQYDQALHAWHTYFPIMPVAEAALADVLDFLRAKLFGGPGGGGTAAALSSVAEADDE